MHEAYGAAVYSGTAVEINALNERTSAIADSDDGDTDFSHGKKEILPVALRLGQDTMWLRCKVKVKAGKGMSGFVRGGNRDTI
jgi:hypothetical protein